MAKKERKNLIKNRRGSALAEKILMVAFSVAMGGALIIYTANIINQSKEVNIRSGIASVETQRVIRNDTVCGNDNVRRFVVEITNMSPAKFDEIDGNGFKYYFANAEFVYQDAGTIQERAYEGGFDRVFNCTLWTSTTNVRSFFNVQDITDQGQILTYNGKNYDYSWEPSGIEKTKEEISANKLYSLWLNDYGSIGKIPVIKVVKEYTGLGLKDAKEKVEEAKPCVLCERWTGEEILPFCNALDALGSDMSYTIKTA